MAPPITDTRAAFTAALRNFEQRKFQVARKSLLELLRIYPREPELLRILGACCSELHIHDDAVAYFRNAVEIGQQPADHFNLGKALQLAQRFDDALAAHEAGLKLAPDDLALLHARATTLLQLGNAETAESNLRMLLHRDPRNADAWINLATALVQLKRPAEAVRSLNFALEINPSLTNEIIVGLIRARMLVADWTDFQPMVEATEKAAATGAKVDPFVLLTISDKPDLHLKAARSNLPQFQPNFAPPLNATRERIKVAYISADYREHPIAPLVSDLFAAHKRSGFEIIAVSIGPDDGSPVRNRLAGAADEFIDLARSPPDRVAEVVRSLNPDIAVDLMGHTKFAMPAAFQLRMAPVQVNFLGYPGTTGSSQIDYVVLDPFVASQTVRNAMVEKAIVLPHCYLPADRQRPCPPRAAAQKRVDLGLPEDAIVFGAFNNAGKITPWIFSAWMRILQAVPKSVLWLRGSDPDLISNLQSEASKAGVDSHRLVFAGVAAYEQHLARHHAMDLFLDTFPYGGHTTVNDALWMGCPVVTLVGQSFASRVAGSNLQSVGLPDLAVSRLTEYESLATELGRSPARVAALKQHLETQRSASPLFDMEGFVFGLETAYRQVVDRARAGQKPKAILVPPSPA